MSATLPDSGVLRSCNIETPLGPMRAVSDGAALRLLEFADEARIIRQLAGLRQRDDRAVEEDASGQDPILALVARELRAYFAGSLRSFEVPIRAPGTGFQERVWAELLRIGFGEIRSYLDVAKRLGDPAATRAVGRANGDNRIAIVIPCHRVIGADGTLTGYGGGLERKKWLLSHERSLMGGQLWGA